MTKYTANIRKTADGSFYVLTNERDAKFFDLYKYDGKSYQRSLVYQNDAGYDVAGISPDGRHYYPAFPYTSYARMTPGDIADLAPTTPARRRSCRACHSISQRKRERHDQAWWWSKCSDDEQSRQRLPNSRHCG